LPLAADPPTASRDQNTVDFLTTGRAIDLATVSILGVPVVTLLATLDDSIPAESIDPRTILAATIAAQCVAVVTRFFSDRDFAISARIGTWWQSLVPEKLEGRIGVPRKARRRFPVLEPVQLSRIEPTRKDAARITQPDLVLTSTGNQKTTCRLQTPFGRKDVDPAG
jgi:hypothetical protein